jgi:hypothetical protein
MSTFANKNSLKESGCSLKIFGNCPDNLYLCNIITND